MDSTLKEQRKQEMDASATGRRLEDVAVRFAEEIGRLQSTRSCDNTQVVDRDTANFLLQFHKHALERAKQPPPPREYDEQKLAQDIGQALILLKSPEDFQLSMARLYLTGALVALGRADLVARA